MTKFRTKTKKDGEKQVYPIVEGKEIRRTDDFDTENKKRVRRFKGNSFEMQKDGFESKQDAQKSAESIRMATGKKVRVKNIYGTWGVWTEEGTGDKSMKKESIQVKREKRGEKYIAYPIGKGVYNVRYKDGNRERDIRVKAKSPEDAENQARKKVAKWKVIQSKPEKDTFMTYKEYQRKQKELTKEGKEITDRQDFAYSGMGQIDTSGDKRKQELYEESQELQKKAEAYSKEHPDWVK